MGVQAKVAASEGALPTAPEQIIGQSVLIPAGSSVALDIPERSVAGYSREGADLVVHLLDGERVRIAGFYADPQAASHLYLIEDDKLAYASLADAAPDGTVAVTYAPETTSCGFSTSDAQAPAAGPAMETTTDTSSSSSSWLLPAALIGGAAAIGGIALAVSGHGSHDNASSGGGGSTTTTPVTVPPATNLTFSADGSTLSGSAVAGDTVTIDVNGDGKPDVSVVADSSGHFQVTLPTPLTDGHPVTVWVTDPAGNQSVSATADAPEIAPAAPVAVPSNGSVLSGTAEANSTITITLISEGGQSAFARGAALDSTVSGTVIGTTTTDANGHWTLTLSSKLPNGTVVDITATDAAGNVSQETTLTIDGVAPTAPTVEPSNGTELTGTAEAGSTVTLSVDGTVIGTTTADSTGHWSFTPTSSLANGTVIDITATDAAGNVSSQGSISVDSVPPSPPAITSDSGTTIAGTGEAGDTITLYDASGTVIGTTLVDSTGHWTYTPTTPLAAGTTVTITQTDPSGNVSQVATTEPGSGSGGSVSIPGTPTVTTYTGSLVSGTAQAGSTVTLTNAGGTVIGTATADGTGHWSVSGAFANGLAVTVIASDSAGQSSPASVTIDAVIPAAPAIAGSNGMTIAGTGEIGDTVTLTNAGGTVIGTALVGGNGQWAFTPATTLANGTVLHVTQTDPAGNVSAQTTLTTDVLLPGTPTVAANNGQHAFTGTGDVGDVITVSAGGTVLGTAVVQANGIWSVTPSGTESNGTVVTVTASNGGHSISTTVTIDAVAPASPSIATSNGTVIQGTAEAGSIITLTDSGGSLGTVTVTANSNGAWSYTPATRLANGDQIHATATDAAGNVSSQGSTTVDATPPAAPVVHVTAHGAVLSGTGDAGNTVTVTDATGNMIGTTTVTGGGTWTLTPTVPLDNGTVVRASETDAAGNVSQQGSAVVDTTPPAAPTIAVSNGTALSGTAEANSTVTVTYNNGSAVQLTATADSTGHWSVTPGSPIANNITLTATATDASGNVSTANTTVIDAQAPNAPSVSASNGSHVVGTAEAGSTVTLTDGGVTATATADANGNWSIDLTATPLANGSTASVTATDAAGNVSSAGVIVIDTTQPSIPTVAASNGTVLQGTGDAGDTVTVTDVNGIVIGTTTVQGNGSWSLTPGTPLADGTIVHIADSNGSGASAAVTIAVDATAPLVPVVSVGNGTVISGTAEAGSIVTITYTDAGGVEIVQTIAGANGSWSFVPPSSAIGGTTISVVATDAAGNTSLVGTAIVDTTAPAAPVSAATAGTIVTGTAEAGSTVTLTDSSGTVLATTTVGTNGYWSIALASPQANGATLHAFATDAAGNQSASNTITVDSVAPTVPVIAATNGQVLTGTAEAGSTVTITLTAANGTVLGHTLTGVDGSWSFTPLTPLANGTVVDATATDAAGNTSLVGTAVVDTTAPAAPTVALSNGTTISGTAEAGSTVTLTDGSGHAIGTTVAGTDGHWAFQPSSPLANATVIHATATDAAGNVSTAGNGIVDSVAPTAPTIALRTAAAVTGTAEAGSIITVTDDSGTLIGQTTTSASGNWSFTAPGGSLADGTVVHVTATDAAGNISGQTIAIVDAVTPAAPVIAASQGAIVTGTAEAGSSVTLTSGATVIATVTADSTGHWTYSPTTALANGTQITATATDAAGNVSPASTGTIDSVAPATPVIAPNNGITLSGTAEAGSIVTLTSGSGTVIGTTIATSAGTWSFTPSSPLANGTAVHASATDAAGNVSAQATTNVDSVAPATPVMALSNGTVVTGTAEAGATVILVDASNNLIGQTTAASNGSWSFTPSAPLTNGTIVNALAVDASGNASGQSTVTVDSVAPAAPTVVASNGTVLHGTAEAGATITLTNAGGTVIGTTTAASDGSWSFTPAAQLANNAAVRITATDATGNVSTQSSVTIDRVAPAVSIEAASHGASVTGTAEAGATITLTDGNGALIGTTIAASDGSWGFTPASPLADSTVVKASAADAAGNVSSQVSLTIDAVAPAAPTVAISNGTLLHGTAEAGSAITLLDINGTVIGHTTTLSNGTWSFTPGSQLADGTLVDATATDAAGNVSPIGATIVDAAPPSAPVIAVSNGHTVSGTAEAGSSVVLSDSGGTIATVTADSNGNWSVTGLSLGNNDLVSAVATDAAGNHSTAGTVTTDTIAPSQPILDPTSGAELSGTGEVGSTITLTDSNGNFIGSTTVDPTGHWIYPSTGGTLGLPNGTVIDATATDAAGNTSLASSVTVDITVPTAPLIAPSNGTAIDGYSDPGAIITLTDVHGNIITTLTADGTTGFWDYFPSTPYANGTVIQASAQDSVGGPSSAIGIVIVDTVAPNAPVVNASNGAVLIGTAEAGSQIIAVDGSGSFLGATTADSTGHWTVILGSTLSNGTTVLATATDAAGNTSLLSTAITIDSVAPPAPVIAASNGVVITGTEPVSEAGDTITLTDANGTVIGTTIVAANGTWTWTPATALVNSTVVHATATDAAGNVSLQGTVTVDTIAPAAPVVAVSNGTVIQGTGEVGSIITLIDGSGNLIGQTIVAGNGHWSFTPTTPLANGLIVDATATDAAGNVSPFGATVIDAVAPPAPVLAATTGVIVGGTGEAGATVTVLNGSGVSIGTATVDLTGHWSVTVSTPQANGATVFAYETDAAGNVSTQSSIVVDSVAPPAPVIAASNGLTVHGTEPTSEAGDTITVTDGSGNAIGTAIVASDGTWSVTPATRLTNGTVVHASATDAAGNVSTLASATVDTVAPAAPIVAASNGVTVSGTAEAGSLVTITDGNGNLIGQTITAGSGSWSYTPSSPLANGTVLHATATDDAGNASPQGTNVVDSVAPAAPVISPTNGTVISGTGEVGDTVIVKNAGGTVIGTTTVAADGTWSVTLGTPLANAATATATQTDAAGNISPQSSVTADSVAPAAPVIAASNGVTLHGTSEAGATLALTDGSGHAIGTVIVASNGSWSYTPASPLAGGTVVHATATDAAGNISTQATATIDTTPPAAPTGVAVSANGTSLTGIAEANSTITILVNGDTSHPITGTTDGSGHISISLSPALVDGQTLTVTATDAAGNVGASATVYAPELTPPVVTIAAAADGYINAAELTAGIQAKIGITAGMHVGDTISVTLNDTPGGGGSYSLTIQHVITAADKAAGTATIALVPGAGSIPDGTVNVTANLNGGSSSNVVGFTIDSSVPTTPVLSLLNNVLTAFTTPGASLVVDAVIAGVHFTESLTANSSGLASVNLLTDLSANLSWDQLLSASVSAYATDAAGNTSSIASIGVAANLIQPPTVGSFALNVALIPATLGFSGTTGVGDTLSVSVITPAATIHLAPAVDSSGHFAVNLLSASVLSQLGLSVTQILNLGAGLAFEITATDASGHTSATYDLTLLGSGASLSIGTITVNGTLGDDILTSTTGSVENFVAGAGNDLIQHVLAGDTVNAGAGNDTIQVKAAGFTSIAGGTGFDTVLFENGITLNYSSGTPNITGIERFNLGTNGNLTLTASAINTVTDGGNVLQITGDSTDTLKITGATSTGTTQTINGSIYDVYHLGAATLLVQHNTVHVTLT